MEKSLRYAIEKSKRNIRENKYSKIENVLCPIYEYCIRLDEVDTMIESINKWIEKNNDNDYFVSLNETYDAHDIEYIKENI